MLNTILSNIKESLLNIGVNQLNPMQQEVMENFESKNDLLLLAKTGSGKTIAFLLPILLKIKADSLSQTLIVAPTRELVLQIESVAKSLKSGLNIMSCYGGNPVKAELNKLLENPSVIISTPGRLCDHISRNYINLESLNVLVLDEYDKCLEFGFQDQLEFIIKHITSKSFKKILVSATEINNYPSFIKLNDLVTLNYFSEPPVDLTFYKIKTTESYLQSELSQLLLNFGKEKSIVFCNFRESVSKITSFLKSSGFSAVSYHGLLDQSERERSLMKFRNGTATVLVSTDLSSRGLDISELNHIVHTEFPDKEASFIHRNGRTARMNAKGNCYLLYKEEDVTIDYLEKFIAIAQPINLKLQNEIEIPEMETIYFSGGKRDKINKIDLVGFLIHSCRLMPEQIGLIQVNAEESFVAVKKSAVQLILQNGQQQKVKGKKLKIAIAK
jgi:ATP-independent RNA helicase DbpA